MKNLILLVLFLFTIQVNGQIIKEAKKDLEGLRAQFDTLKVAFDTQNRDLDSLKSKIGPQTNDAFLTELNDQIKKTKTTGLLLDSISKVAESYKTFYLNKSDDRSQSFIDSLTTFFPYKYELKKDDESSSTQKTLLYFGKDKVIEEQDGVFKDKKYNLIFNDILEAKSESYLGDFIIPQKGQKITCKNKKIVYFKSIKIHISEGSLDEIQLLVTDENNNDLLFENLIPISLLRATSLFPRNHLFFKTITSNNKNTSINIDDYKDKDYEIWVSDALAYIPNPGENYIPEDLTLEFPTKTDGTDDNTNNAVKYKVNQDTSLQNIVELRTYTDFLGLFTENSPNGIVQLEGKADFFIAPSLSNIDPAYYLFKKL